MIVNVQLDRVDAGLIMVEPNQELAEKYGLVMAPCLIDLDDNAYIRAVQIMNPSDDFVSLR